jgi:hypothetical protein
MGVESLPPACAGGVPTAGTACQYKNEGCQHEGQMEKRATELHSITLMFTSPLPHIHL